MRVASLGLPEAVEGLPRLPTSAHARSADERKVIRSALLESIPRSRRPCQAASVSGPEQPLENPQPRARSSSACACRPERGDHDVDRLGTAPVADGERSSRFAHRGSYDERKQGQIRRSRARRRRRDRRGSPICLTVRRPWGRFAVRGFPRSSIFRPGVGTRSFQRPRPASDCRAGFGHSSLLRYPARATVVGGLTRAAPPLLVNFTRRAGERGGWPRRPSS